jgi:hypothetical protein
MFSPVKNHAWFLRWIPRWFQSIRAWYRVSVSQSLVVNHIFNIFRASIASSVSFRTPLAIGMPDHKCCPWNGPEAFFGLWCQPGCAFSAILVSVWVGGWGPQAYPLYKFQMMCMYHFSYFYSFDAVPIIFVFKKSNTLLKNIRIAVLSSFEIVCTNNSWAPILLF